MIYKKLSSIGNSWGLVIPKVLLENLNINPVIDEVGLEVKEDYIIIRKRKKED